MSGGVHEIELHSDDQEMRRLIEKLAQYTGKDVVALVLADADGQLSVIGPVQIPTVRKIAEALVAAGIGHVEIDW